MTRRSPYFATLDQALKTAGITGPVMVIDRDRLDANVTRLRDDLPDGMGCRIVAKSLPSPDLLRYVMGAVGTDRVMSFNLPMLRQIAQDMPGLHQLLGKPLSTAAMQDWFSGPVSGARITWLIDSISRLEDASAIARAAGGVVEFAFEIDIGLHRGGFTPGDSLAAALALEAQDPHLRCVGMMGYDPHVASVPQIFGWRARVQRRARAAYAAAKAQIGPRDGGIFNAAGSPTYRLYRDTGLANEIAIGSALVKPVDFDTPLLAGHQPAAFIATPVLKGPMPTRLPALEWLPVAPKRRETVFIHGGRWMARPEDPPGLRNNPTYGRSSNQEMLNAAHIPLTRGDFLFLRPTQSETVLLQFGPLVVVSGGSVVDHWPTFDVSA